MKSTQMKSCYGPNVRLGNWFEDIRLEEEEVNEFQNLRRNKQLLIDKTEQLFRNFHTEIDLEAPSDTIKIGAIVQLIAVRMNICKKNVVSSLKPALSVIINETVVRQSQKISDKCELTVAPARKPYVRNSFMIKSGDEKDRTNELLKYGQDFRLQCVDTEDDPLFLYSAQKSADLSLMIPSTFDSFSRGELNLNVGLCLEKNCGPSKGLPTAYMRWRCYNIDPSLRFETDGLPVPSNTPLIITHSATNKNLAAENIVIPTLFGPEFLVSVQTYTDNYNRETWQNVWQISIGNAHKFAK